MTESPATVSVNQADREAAAAIMDAAGHSQAVCDAVRAGLNDHWQAPQLFAAHRLSAIASVTDAPDPTATLDARLNERKSLFKQMRDHDAPAIPAQPDSIPLPEPTAEQQGYLNKRWAAHLRSQQFDPNTVIGGPSPAQPDGGLVEKLEALVHAVGVTHRKFDGYELGDTLSFVTQTREVDTAKVALANHVLDQWGPLLEALRRPAPDDLPDLGVAMVSEPGRDAVLADACEAIQLMQESRLGSGEWCLSTWRATKEAAGDAVAALSLKATPSPSIPEDEVERVFKAAEEELLSMAPAPEHTRAVRKVDRKTVIALLWRTRDAAIASMPRLDQVRREERERCAKVADDLLSVAKAMHFAAGSGSGMAWMSAAEAEGFACRVEDIAARLRAPSNEERE